MRPVGKVSFLRFCALACHVEKTNGCPVTTIGFSAYIWVFSYTTIVNPEILSHRKSPPEILRPLFISRQWRYRKLLEFLLSEPLISLSFRMAYDVAPRNFRFFNQLAVSCRIDYVYFSSLVSFLTFSDVTVRK